MRRPGNYGDSGGNAYSHAQMQHMSSQSHYQGQTDEITEKEHAYGASKAEGQWRWQRDESKGSSPMSPHMFNEGQVGEASRPYFQGQRLDSKIVTKKEANTDPRSNRHEEDMDVGCEDKHVLQTFEGLEKRFFEDIMKLSKEQTDAEDAESARHKERKDAINLQYEEQLVALRARHSARRDDFFRRESLAREQQYQQSVVDQYSSNSAARPTDQFDSYREHRARYPAGHRDDHGFDPRAASYAGGGGGGRAYETGSRYY
ncbi:uncharacterized protein LOC124935782 isoform X2 [Impatiens glandulifera]|uniref:uncharacterized protein LOC124935782 isoform X2 n=1 Tax=Impatiens glandulifera TaxID=253017 RepID=UPI001FB0850A|nr:uncharacterized protein LOC124935782 isoform X2 [Impatiens glandulifera]